MCGKFGYDAGVNIEAVTLSSQNSSTKKVNVPLIQPYTVECGGNVNQGCNQNGPSHGYGYTGSGYTGGGCTYLWRNQGDRRPR
ncbi:hypothetical protein LTR17_018084 [Elasticomyces elasticus]|nr:hypothetical protein LTR17_018084 [Elasticomyces elasticus]